MPKEVKRKMNEKEIKEIAEEDIENILEPFRLKTLPSETYDCYWLEIKRIPDSKDKYPKDTINGGKWLIFRSKEKIDKQWKKIRFSTMLGVLGNRSKVSTAKPNPNASNSKSFVICVYTYDSNDKKDVKRIRKELKSLGVKETIRYKTNKATLEGKYTNKGFKKISKYKS